MGKNLYLWKKNWRYKPDTFILSLLGCILLAYLYPYPGTDRSHLYLNETANIGVSLIFFFYGLKLGVRKLAAGLSNWKLHLFVQLITFLLFPVIGWILRPFFSGEAGEMLWFGIFFLCILPSTVSSSVVMVGIAGGNVPAAIFNASISSLLGVFITPLWLGLFSFGGDAVISLNDVILKLILQVLLPVMAGMLLFNKLEGWALGRAKWIRTFDQAIILLIVYCSFCKSFDENLFDGLAFRDLFLLSLGMLALFGVVFYFTWWMGQRLHFNREDKITAAFCGSKKSLVQGALMSNVMFAGSPFAGIVLIPIMIYHALQLVIVGIIAQRKAREL